LRLLALFYLYGDSKKRFKIAAFFNFLFLWTTYWALCFLDVIIKKRRR
jgi:hypothetical protein